MSRQDRARDYVISYRGNFKQLMNDINVSHSWLSKFSNKHIRDAGSDRVDAILAHKEQTKLSDCA